MQEVHAAVHAAGQTRRASCDTFVLHLPEADSDVRAVQQVLCHRDVSTTMNDSHVLLRGGCIVIPLDRL
ncbi:hypothetical protein ElP_49250 [Tautonia plasticadhaerens]|uniref:Tyr recombinase domain-containing protein n=1 Tax=Tautonia plasticadhaerens TaxID=2527974 RepID=A0A518H825_9BACT|nr:hypothetical protein ElP_49250 [Tautonia plasticadhaerens]